jgi:hypothetical protein
MPPTRRAARSGRRDNSSTSHRRSRKRRFSTRPSCSWIGPTHLTQEQHYITEQQYHQLVPSRDHIPRVHEKVAWKLWPDTMQITICGAKNSPHQSRSQNFILSENRNPPGWRNGDCYWRALAMIFHGDSAYFPHVKAEHYRFLHDITITGPRDPNFEFWRSIASVTNKDGVNIAQQLRTGNEEASGDMFELTAHLYRVCIVLFIFRNGVDRSIPSDIYYFGAKNREQIFVAAEVSSKDNLPFAGHLMPLYPEVLEPEEFRWLELDLDCWAVDKDQHRASRIDGRGYESAQPMAPSMLRRTPISISHEDIQQTTGIRVKRSQGPFHHWTVEKHQSDSPEAKHHHNTLAEDG